jgi:hypothetical protein
MIEIILALLVGIWIGKTVTNAWNQFTFMEILKDLKVSTEDLRKLREQQDGILDPEPRDEIEIKIEQHQGQLYAFRTDTDEFLGQGDNRDTLASRIAERHKGVKFRIPADKGAELMKG